MAKPELGLKRVCVACGTKFYDLTRAPAVCPKCGTEQPAEQPRLRRPGGGAAAAAPAEDKLKRRAVVAPEAESEEVELEEVEGEEAIEDAEELEDESEGIGEDIEVEGDRDEEG